MNIPGRPIEVLASNFVPPTTMFLTLLVRSDELEFIFVLLMQQMAKGQQAQTGII